MSARLDWERDGRDWPHRDASRFVAAAGLRWHVQLFGPPPDGTAPVALLIHGTGASTHSWRDVAPALAGAGLSVVAMDLPGHAFTSEPSSSWHWTLPGMARSVAALADALGAAPAVIVGHSAGAAIAARISLDGHAEPRNIVAFNAAMLPLGGLGSRLFAPVAQLLAAVPLVPRLFSWHASDRAVVQRLLDATGSRLDAAGTALYGRLVANPGHAAAALAMMANWDLESLEADLPRLQPRLRLVVGDRDRTVPPEHSHRVAARVPGALVGVMPELGHLAHEERPVEAARIVTGELG